MKVSPNIEELLDEYMQLELPTYINYESFKRVVAKVYRFAVLNNFIELQSLCMQCLSNINSCYLNAEYEETRPIDVKLQYFYESIKHALYAISQVNYVPTFPPHVYPEDE